MDSTLLNLSSVRNIITCAPNISILHALDSYAVHHLLTNKLFHNNYAALLNKPHYALGYTPFIRLTVL